MLWKFEFLTCVFAVNWIVFRRRRWKVRGKKSFDLIWIEFELIWFGSKVEVLEMASRKEDEKNERIIRNLLKLPDNRRCINCKSLVILIFSEFWLDNLVIMFLNIILARTWFVWCICLSKFCFGVLVNSVVLRITV